MNDNKDLRQWLESKFDSIDKRFDAVDKKIDVKFNELDKKIDVKFNELDKKIDVKFNELDKKIDVKFAFVLDDTGVIKQQLLSYLNGLDISVKVITKALDSSLEFTLVIDKVEQETPQKIAEIISLVKSGGYSVVP